ncbi:MAG: alpha/beta hydrolase [Bacteroidota bacterium]
MKLLLRLFLFYYHKMKKNPDYTKAKPKKVRAYNKAELDKVGDLIDDKPLEMAKVSNQTITVRDGSTIPIRIYTPDAEGPLPVIIFYHGGGFVTRSIDSHDRACRRLAFNNNATVVSVGYRLAPEFKFPIPVHDSYDAYQSVIDSIDYSAGLSVMGDSAGANLATVVCILAKEAGTSKIDKQVLIYPVTDATMSSPSIDKYAEGYLLTKDLMKWFVDHYKRDDADLTNPLMSPLFSDNLAGLPPAFVSTAGLDPLKDEGQAYAEKLAEMGVDVIYKDYPNVIHGFLNLPKITRQANVRLHRDISAFLQKTSTAT